MPSGTNLDRARPALTKSAQHLDEALVTGRRNERRTPRSAAAVPPGRVFRYAHDQGHYELYAAVRLKPALELLEMKANLRASDRASLIGNTNFIVVITKGTDKLPAKPAEIANLQEQARVLARLPVPIGDHRLHVEIVAPPLDNTLMQSRWEVLDSRLVFAALRSYAPVVQGGNSSGTGVSEMGRVIAKGLENRRHMILRTLEKRIFKAIIDRNAGVPDFDEMPSLRFTPKRISLDFSADIIGQILKLRDRGDILHSSAGA